MDASIKDKLIDLVKARLENEEWVGTVEKVDGEPKQLKVITTDKYIIVVEIDEDGTVKIIEEGPDDGEPYPSLKLTQEPYNEDDGATIRIKVEAEVEKTTKTKKVTTVRIVKPESMKEEKEYAEGGVIFEVTENGVYTFEAETNMGKTKRKTIEINISKPESDIEITSEPITPRNTKSTGTQNGIAKGLINVEIKYGDNSYIKQYRKETEESWTNVTGTTASFTVTENVAIFARYFDGTNSFKTVTYNIQNVDNESPKAFNVTETHTTNSITVGASTTDTASTGASSTIAGILRYEYRIYKNSAWQGWQTAKTFTGLTTGTYKVQAKAIDKAGNETISSESANITLGTVSTEDIKVSSSPTTPRNTGTAGTQNGVAKGPITVSITYGNSSYTRQYKIGTSGSWINVTGTTASFTVTENVAIFARYFDGTNGFQTQAYNIQNVDNVAPTISSYNATVSKNVITATCTATDTASTGASSTTAGILRYEYSNGGTTYQTSNTFTVSKAGTYTIYMKAIDKAGNQTIVNKQVTVSSYTVTYNANGGSGAPASQTAISGINLTLSSTVPTRNGYTFLGWSTSSTATTATYAKGATYTANKTVTLYAVWKYNITGVEWTDISTPVSYGGGVNCNEGTIHLHSLNSLKSKITLNVPGAGYKFTVTDDTSSSSYIKTYDESGTVINEIGDGKNSIKDKYITTTSNTRKVEVILESSGYLASTYLDVKVTKTDGTACKITDSRPEYTMSYYMNNGTSNLYNTIKVKKFEDVVYPTTNPTRSGYRFYKWSLQQDNVSTGAPYVSGDSTWYAIWNQIYTINYYKNDGTTTKYATQTGINGESLNVPTAPTRSGYPFIGWSTDKNARSGYTDKITVTGNANYYALWQQPSVTISSSYTWGWSYDSSTGTASGSGPGCTIIIPSAGYNITVTALSGGAATAYDSSGNALWNCNGNSLDSATGEKTYTTTGETTRITLGGTVSIKITLKDGSVCKITE